MRVGSNGKLTGVSCSLNYLLTSSGGSPDEPPRVMTLFDVIRAIKFIEADDRIVSAFVMEAGGEAPERYVPSTASSQISLRLRSHPYRLTAWVSLSSRKSKMRSLAFEGRSRPRWEPGRMGGVRSRGRTPSRVKDSICWLRVRFRSFHHIPTTVFNSAFTSAFDEIYTQKTGDVPLVGMGPLRRS